MFYRTQIKSMSAGCITDEKGKTLFLTGNLPCQIGDYVWTDGNFVFGHMPIRGTPLIFGEGSGIPVLGGSDSLRGYFNKKGNFKRYNVADDNWLVNSDSVFKHGSTDLFDAEISKNSSLFSISATNDGVYYSLDDTTISESIVSIEEDEAIISSLDASSYWRANFYGRTTENLLEKIITGNGIYEPQALDYSNYNKISQLLSGKIDTAGNYNLLFGSYTSADFLFPPKEVITSVTLDSSLNIQKSEVTEPHIPSTPSSDNFVTGFKHSSLVTYTRDDFIDATLDLDWNFTKSKYTEDNHYLDAEIAPTQDNINHTYSELIDFRKDNDTRLRQALIAFLEDCADRKFATVEVEEYEPIFNPNINSSTIPSFQALAYKLVENGVDATLFTMYDAEAELQTAQGFEDVANAYELRIKYYDETPPVDEKLKGNIQPLVGNMLLYDEDAYYLAIGAVVFLDNVKDVVDPVLETLNGRFIVCNWCQDSAGNNLFPTGIITYKFYPVKYGSGVIEGTTYLFYLGQPKHFFDKIYTVGEPTTHFTFHGSNQETYNCWFTRNATKFRYGMTIGAGQTFSFPVQDDYSLNFNVNEAGKFSLEGIFKDSEFVAKLPEQSYHVPNNGVFSKLDNFSVAPLGNDATYGYLIGSYGNGLYKFYNDSLNKLDDDLKNFRLRELKNISKAKK